MPYRSTEKTREKKGAKRTSMMQAALNIFADKGYQAATIRDIVAEAEVSVGTFYFYFPDKETLFIHLYEETADFLLRTLQQAVNSRATLPQQITAGVRAYARIALFEPAVIQLLLVGGVGAIPSVEVKRIAFREKLIQVWQRPLTTALDRNMIAPQNERRTAEGLTGAFDEMILNLLGQPDREEQSEATIRDMIQFALRAVAYTGTDQ